MTAEADADALKDFREFKKCGLFLAARFAILNACICHAL
jgi:hypothetical protein